MDKRAKALEQLINDTPIKIGKSMYRWNSLYYEVKPYSEIRKKGKRGGNITKYVYITYGGVRFGIWELTSSMTRKLLLDKPSVI